MIEIEKPAAEPLFSFNENCRCYLSTNSIQEWASLNEQEQMKRLMPSDHVMNMGASHAKYSDHNLLLPPWRPRPSKNDDAAGDRISGVDDIIDPSGDPIYSTHAGQELFVRAKITPGLSGAPLVNDVLKDAKSSPQLYRLAGVALNFNRFERGTHFGSEKAFLSLRQKYIEEGVRGAVGKTIWHLRNGLTYRTLGDDSAEINPLNLESGNGISADGGSSAQSTATTNIKFGMLWRGKDTLGLKLTDHQGKITHLLANIAADDFVKEQEKNLLSVESIPAGSSLLSAFSNRFGKSENEDFTITAEWKLMMKPNFTIYSTTVGKFGKMIQIVLKTTKYRRHFFSGIPEADSQETATIVLDEYGIPIGQKEKTFHPIVQLKDKNSQTVYQFNIGDLFLRDINTTKSDKEGNPIAESPSIRIRKEGSFSELHFRFEVPKPRFWNDDLDISCSKNLEHNEQVQELMEQVSGIIQRVK